MNEHGYDFLQDLAVLILFFVVCFVVGTVLALLWHLLT